MSIPTTVPIALGSRYNTQQGQIGIPAGPSGEDPGLLYLESVDATASTYSGIYLWADSGGNLRTHTSVPTDENVDGTIIGAVGGYANAALSNVASVAINESLISDTDDTDDLGSNAKQWKDLYINGVAYIDDMRGDAGTLGDATGSDKVTWDSSGVVALAGAATIDGIGTGNFVDKSATEAVTGAWTFSHASGLIASGTAGLVSDVVSERNLGSGVTVDSLLIKDQEVYVGTDNKKIYFGSTALTDSYIYFDGAGNLTFYDTTAGVVTLSSLSGATLTNPTVTGDLVITNGLLTWTDSTDEIAGTWTFSNVTNDGIDIIANSATTSNVLHVASTSLTSGTLIRADAAEGTLNTGYYFEAYDSGSSTVWSVAEDGVTTITGGTGDALVINVGDIQLTNGNIDMDEGKLEINSTADEASYVNRNNATGTAAAFQVIEDNASGGSAMLIDHDTTAGKPALVIDSEVTDDVSIDIQTPQQTTGNVIQIDDANSLTTGSILSLKSNSADVSARNLVYIENTHASADAAVCLKMKQVGAEPALFIDQDGEDSAIEIDSEATTDQVINIDADALTTGDGIFMTADALTTGGAMLHLVSDSADTNARNLVEVINDNTLAVATDCLYIQNDAIAGKGIVSTGNIEVTIADTMNTVAGVFTANDATNNKDAIDAVVANGNTGHGLWIDHNETTAGTALGIDSESVGGILIDINAPVLTTGWVLQANDANAFTSGGFLNLISDSASTTARSLVVLTNDNTAADATELINMKQDGENRSVYILQNAIAEAISINQDANSASAAVALLIDTDNAGTGNQIALDIDQVDETKSYFARFNATTTWTSAKNPETQAESGWIKIMVGTTAYYIPYYTA